MTVRISFADAPSQRLTRQDGQPYWIVVHRGNDLRSDMPITRGVGWMVSKALRYAAWHLRLTPRSWVVAEYGSRDGYQAFPPQREERVGTRTEANVLAENWRDE